MRRAVAVSAAVFAGAVAACIALDPEGIHHNHGISYYARPGPAAVPYVVGVLAIAVAAFRAGNQLPAVDPTSRQLRRALEAVALLLVGIVLTPDWVGQKWDWAHVAVSIALFGSQFALAIWLVVAGARTWVEWTLFVTLTAFGVLAGISEIHWTDQLFAGQIGFQAAFVAILLRSTNVLAADEVAGNTPVPA